ncbi:MAG TPA: TIR domain-containing protein [Caulobacteraceae bacterium]|jgi:adenylate cyclase|nr:TIR domain-containing protein [Caulobacteraceae bacterium]
MTDVFISYARSTERHAVRVAEALREAGFGVWRDDELPAHRNFTRVIEERLAAAKAVVVIWSSDAAQSEWVQSEADRARRDKKLVQVRVDKTPLPMPFDRLQCVDLCDWAGGCEDHEWSKVVAGVSDLTGDAAMTPPLAAPTAMVGASIAVMPFSNLSNDPEQQYFVEGMAEEIVAALARFRSLHVIAASATLMARGRPLTPQEAARELGVGYLLEGSVRKSGARVRITVHLVDAASGTELWSERFEDDTGDVFALQDKVAERVAGVAENAVQDADHGKAATRATQDLSSYDLYLRSLYLFRASRRRELLESVDLLERAIAGDPDYAAALAHACVNLRQIVDHGWTDDPDGARAKALGYAERALRLAPNDHSVLAMVAASLPGIEGYMDRALTLIDRATALNPASGFAWLISGSIRLRAGEPDTAAIHLERAMQLDPLSSMNGYMRMYLASARFQQRRFSEALALFRTTTYRMPVSYAILASLHGHLGQAAQARQALAELEALEAGSVEKFADIWFPRPEYRALLLGGIAAALAPAAAPG